MSHIKNINRDVDLRGLFEGPNAECVASSSLYIESLANVKELTWKGIEIPQEDFELIRKYFISHTKLLNLTKEIIESIRYKFPDSHLYLEHSKSSDEYLIMIVRQKIYPKNYSKMVKEFYKSELEKIMESGGNLIIMTDYQYAK